MIQIQIGTFNPTRALIDSWDLLRPLSDTSLSVAFEKIQGGSWSTENLLRVFRFFFQRNVWSSAWQRGRRRSGWNDFSAWDSNPLSFDNVLLATFLKETWRPYMANVHLSARYPWNQHERIFKRYLDEVLDQFRSEKHAAQCVSDFRYWTIQTLGQVRGYFIILHREKFSNANSGNFHRWSI